MNSSIGYIWLYALCNEINEEIYIGISESPDRRILEHNKGKNRYTKAFMPWSAFYFERFNDYGNARISEIYYKKSHNKRKLKVYLEKWRQFGTPTTIVN